MRRFIGGVLLAAGLVSIGAAQEKQEDKAAAPASKSYRVLKTDDFELQTPASVAAWEKAAWEPLSVNGGGQHAYDARFKALYSPRGLYVLMNGKDEKLAATMQEDYLNLWTEDVFEVFLRPDTKENVYFEYEISPLGRELPILIHNIDGKFQGWRPWMYDGGRKVKKVAVVHGGEQKPGAKISGWTAEIFFPYDLLKPLRNVPPQPGVAWKANFYRMDYDTGRAAWHWSPVGRSFHEYEKFGTLTFE